MSYRTDNMRSCMDNNRQGRDDSDVSQQQAATASDAGASVAPVARFPSLIKTDHPNRASMAARG